MEKLIELLNKCKGKSYRFGINGDNSIYQKETDAYGKIHITSLPDYKLISKQFGFIKRLVEKDKIDLGEKLFNLTKNDNRKSIICDLDNNDFSWEDTFLMLLSISNSPIKDLISYLK